MILQSGFEASIVRIVVHGETKGTGFVASDGLIATCAHVVKAAAGPGSNLRVAFHDIAEERMAQVASEWWREPDADDVAILRLDGPLPAGVVPIRLGFTRHCNGHRLQTLGFPELPGGYETAWAEGEIRGVVPHPGKRPMLQLNAKPIRPGMSGAPVLDLNTQRVVGMVSEYMPDAPLEWATTSETLKDVCPELELRPPQAIEDYLNALRDYCTNLPYLTLHDIRSPKTLDEVYVPLKARPQPGAGAKSDHDKEQPGRESLRAESLSVAEVMQQRDPPHILILGEPGTGKSTLLRQIAERAWDAPNTIGLDTPHLPILVPLRRLAQHEGSLENRLNAALTGELSLARELPDGFLETWPAEAGARWLILLDALDEVPVDERARLMQWLKGLLNRIGQNRLVLTSRPAGYSQGEFDEESFGHYSLLAFTADQAREFAYKWFDKRAEDFLQELKRVRVGALSGTPLLLTIAAKVYLEKGSLPERRSGLYGQFVDLWLGEAEQRGLKAELGERMCKVARPALARLALAMTEQPGQGGKVTLSQVTAAYLRSALQLSEDESEADAAQFVDVMARRSGVFTRRGDVHDFIHETFREYLAAAAIVRTCEKDQECIWRRAISHWQDEHWREVALLALGILSEKATDVTHLLERILLKRIPWRRKREALYFVGAALGEQVQVSPNFVAGVIESLRGAARRIKYFETEWPPNALTVLGELRAYPLAADGLLVLARDERVDASVRRRAAYTLGELGRADDLLALARDERVHAKVREPAAEALGKLGRADEAAPILLALARDERVVPAWRRAAAEVLGKLLGRADEAARILLALDRDERAHVSVRLRAAYALGELDRADEAVLKGLLALARDERVYAWVRRRAAEALGKLGRAEEAAPVLLALALDARVDASVRMRAAEALGKLGRAEEAAPVLLALALDARVDASVRTEAAKALGGLGWADEAAPILLALARDERVYAGVRERAAYALGELGRADEAVLKGLLALALDERVHAGVRQRSAYALGELGRADEAVLKGLLALARDKRVGVRVREAAAVALGELGRADDLLALARDERVHADVRWAAEAAIREINRRTGK